WQGIAGIVAIAALIVAIIALPQLQGEGQTATETTTSAPTTEVAATDTAEPPTNAPTHTPTSEAATNTATDAPAIAATEAPTDLATEVYGGATDATGVALTIFRDEDSFTLYAAAGSDLSGLEYRVVTGADESVCRLED